MSGQEDASRQLKFCLDGIHTNLDGSMLLPKAVLPAAAALLQDASLLEKS